MNVFAYMVPIDDSFVARNAGAINLRNTHTGQYEYSTKV